MKRRGKEKLKVIKLKGEKRIFFNRNYI